MKKLCTYLVLIVLSISCGPTKKQNATGQKPDAKQEIAVENQGNNNSYAGFLSSIVKIQTFDNGRILETGQGFFVGEDVFVTRLSLLTDANQATFTPLDDNKSFNISGYLGVDRINNLILLKTDGIKRTPIPLFSGIAPNGEKTIYLTRPNSNTIPLHKGKILSYSTVQGNPLYTITNKFSSGSFGTPLFVSNLEAIGLVYSDVVDYEARYFAIPSVFISELLKKKPAQAIPLEKISQADKAEAIANSNIKALLIETDLGNIKIRLFNETPAYRDNFIKLVREHYYDSLLIHRVIKGFCIQSGAADTRYAGKDDVVGWKGPGYTLPAHIVPGFFHKRGMIGSPRKPDTKNAKRRSDGSQFYIVTGRVYSDAELNEIEKENGIKFTAEQRRIYKIEGGAPHIDGTYTIFGEVLEGMDVADRISKVPIGNEFRPLEDIRIKNIRILE